ncbi:MAG: M20/M25/M40 family metallo-hydrolase [Flavisolibacter sp.]
MKKYCILVFLSISFFADAQKLKKADKQLRAHLQAHIQYLSDDKLQGRRTGTEGERQAAEYISTEFSKLGLTPKGTQSWLQPFEINEGKEISPSTTMIINGNTLELHKDYFPLIISPNTSMEATPSIVLQEPGMPWFFDLKDLLDENATNPHFDINNAIINSAKQVEKKGASAIFIYNSSQRQDGLKFNGKEKTETLGIPMIYLSKGIAGKYLSDESAALDINFRIDILDKKRTGHNVVGFIDNGAPATVVMGAHFDHLGFGEDGNSMIRNQVNQIHNGADDNASGTAALIELARLLRHSKNKHNNYLFIAFSGEELGLYGSKYFTQNPTIDLSSVNYMINMDMVGRLNDSSKTITVGGYGSSPVWGTLYNLKGKKGLYAKELSFRFDSSGTGPSDHTSFYVKNIPVLFYFTGLHTDYHKPSDDADKINYNGTMHIVKHIASVIEKQGKQEGKLAFTKTREAQTTTSARFSVSLGVMPDYTFSGAGLRVDNVSDNRPAQKAGIQAGDIIISLGEHKINSMESYMQALAKFKKGDKTSVSFTRAGKTLSSAVEF